MRSHIKVVSLAIVLPLCFAVVLVPSSFTVFPAAQAQTMTKTLPPDEAPAQSASAAQENSQGPEEERESEDLAPAAVRLNMDGESPLILALYQATRETKEKQILEKLDTARKLIEQNPNLKAVDSFGRTALHWVVFGSSYATKPNVLLAYASIAELLISHGVDLNQEDKYNDTALDYLLYSPNFDMQTLLLERGATSGFFNATLRFMQENQPIHHSANAEFFWAATDLAPGLIFSIRLKTPAWSDQSRTGDPIEAVVTAPLMSGDTVLLAPGTKVDGTVLFAQKAPDKYSRPRLVLDFSNVLHANGKKSLLYTRVVAVDNARETVRNNEILGIIQPHASGKVSVAFSALGSLNPAANYGIKGIQTAYGLSLRREIHYPVGTDLIIQVTRPSRLMARQTWPGWPALTVKPDLQRLVKEAPVRAERGKTPADVINVLFLGTEQQLQAAFQEAGWALADARSFGADLKALQASLRQSGYKGAPVSLLTLHGAAPDLVFQKSLNTFAKRHHLRLWQQSTTYEGQTVWVGAATHDIGIASTAEGTKWFHRIDPQIDRERDLIKTDLLFTGVANGYSLVDRQEVPRNTKNATGDELISDGKLLVLALGPAKPEASQEP
jgi:ankyrin repeat protein